jgi:hypothetical protein
MDHQTADDYAATPDQEDQHGSILRPEDDKPQFDERECSCTPLWVCAYCKYHASKMRAWRERWGIEDEIPY